MDRFEFKEVTAAEEQKRRERAVNHPPHYGGGDNPYEAIKVIRAWDLGFALGNVVKYIARAGRKPGVDLVEDLEKAAWYLNNEIATRKAAQEVAS